MLWGSQSIHEWSKRVTVTGCEQNNSMNEKLNMEVYIDVDYVGSVSNRRTTSGYCMFLGENLVN